MIRLSRWWRGLQRDRKLRRRHDQLEAALDELVYLKDLKERCGPTPEYETRQPLAWQAARKALERAAVGQLKPIRAIEISFPVPVQMNVEHERMLVQFAGWICDEWCRAHPDRTMWPAGQGSKITYMPMTRAEELAGRRMEFDDSVYAIDCVERERYPNDG